MRKEKQPSPKRKFCTRIRLRSQAINQKQAFVSAEELATTIISFLSSEVLPTTLMGSARHNSTTVPECREWMAKEGWSLVPTKEVLEDTWTSKRSSWNLAFAIRRPSKVACSQIWRLWTSSVRRRRTANKLSNCMALRFHATCSHHCLTILFASCEENPLHQYVLKEVGQKNWLLRLPVLLLCKV